MPITSIPENRFFANKALSAHCTVKENKLQNMAIYAVFLIAVCLSATSAVHKPCGVGQCKLVLVGQNPAVAFQQLASEDGVRLVYLNLEIGNNSIHPLESDERFLPKRWIWAKTIREPMLLMTDDAHDIHSLGLLRRQKRYMTVQLAEQPAGCLASLNLSCQDNVVGKTLLSKVTNLSHGNRLPTTDCVCSFHTKKMYREGWEILCCSVKEITEKNSTVYRCGIAPENDWFVKPFYIIYVFLRYILLFYGPAIFLLLPDWAFNPLHEWSKEKEESEGARYRVSRQQHIEMTQVENENEQEEINWDNPVSPNQQENMQIVETEQTMDSGDDTWEEELDRICEKKLSAVHEAQKEIDFELPIDDMSPMTLSALLNDFVKTLPLTHMNFNFRLLLLFFVLFPVVVHIKLAVVFFYELEFYHEVYRKFNYGWSSIILLENEFSFQSIAGENWRSIVGQQIGIGIKAAASCLVFVILICVRPKDLFDFSGDKASRRDLRLPFRLSFFGASIPNRSVSLGENIIHNLTIQRLLVCKLAYSVLELYMTVLKKCVMKLTLKRIRETRLKRALRSFCVTLCFFPGFLIATAFGVAFLLIFLIGFVSLLIVRSPLATFSLFVREKGMGTFKTFTAFARSFSRHIAFKAIVLVIVIVSYLMFVCISYYVIFRSVQVMTNTFLFTIMAVVLNVEFVTPYIAFILVVARNVHLCFLNLQNRYKEVKDMISKHWEEETTNLFCIKCSNNGTIPKELFWFVCSNEELVFEEQILPLRTEICFMLRDMALITLFLGLFFFAVLVFETIEEISAVVSTFFVLISGVIPSLIFTKKKQFSGWDKIKIDNKIKEAVSNYVLSKVSEPPTRGGSRRPAPTVLDTAV